MLVESAVAGESNSRAEQHTERGIPTCCALRVCLMPPRPLVGPAGSPDCLAFGPVGCAEVVEQLLQDAAVGGGFAGVAYSLPISLDRAIPGYVAIGRSTPMRSRNIWGRIGIEAVHM